MTLAVTTYQWFLMVHILAAVVWVGGSATAQVYAIRVVRSGDANRAAGFLKDTEWLGTRVFMPASLLVLVFGFLLVSEGDWGYPFWVIFALAGIAVSFLFGALFVGPEAGRIGKLIEARGAEDAEVQARIGRIFLVSRFDLVVIVLVVIDMTLKPFA